MNCYVVKVKETWISKKDGLQHQGENLYLVSADGIWKIRAAFDREDGVIRYIAPTYTHEQVQDLYKKLQAAKK